MAKLIVLALAFTALAAFASAHTTVVTTTIEEENENPVSRQQCGRQIQGERFNRCEMYLQQGDQTWYDEQDNRRSQMQGGGLQSCCQELQNVDEQCQCAAVKEAFRQAQKIQQQQQGQSYGSQQIKQMKQKAQNLPNQCNLRTKQCQIGTIFFTTTITEENHHGSQQCQQIRGRRFNQCQTYIQQQISGSGSSGTLLMSINRQGRQEPQGLELCCNELQNVEEECQCEAMKEVYWQAQQMQRQQQRGSRGEQKELKQMVQNLRNQCKLQAQQCRISSAMF